MQQENKPQISQIDPDQILTEDEKRACKECFDAFDKMGYGTLKYDELQKVLEELEQKPTKEELIQLINEIDDSKKGYIEYKDFIKAISYYKIIETENEEDDTLEAFVAMGGGIDKQGNVDSVKLIQIVKEEFNMTIDIERLLNEIDTDKSGLISYMEFKTLLSN